MIFAEEDLNSLNAIAGLLASFGCDSQAGCVHQTFEVRATDKQEAIRKGMKTAKKFACGDICGDWECKLKREDSL